MITIWHNPRCSKSRLTLALLKERKLEFKVMRYLDDPPDVDELRATLASLGVPAIKMMRTNEKTFKERGLSKDEPDEVLIAAMTEDPILIERPIVISDGKAAIGRPPEAVLCIL